MAQGLPTRSVQCYSPFRGVIRMPGYRTYCLDGNGKIKLADELEARDDAEAIEKAKVQHRGGIKCELWRRNRLVATLDAHDLAG
jgi:hypothetical protein